jgi:hypothetical protein
MERLKKLTQSQTNKNRKDLTMGLTPKLYEPHVLTTRNHVDIQILTRAGEVGFTILI